MGNYKAAIAAINVVNLLSVVDSVFEVCIVDNLVYAMIVVNVVYLMIVVNECSKRCVCVLSLSNAVVIVVCCKCVDCGKYDHFIKWVC